MWRYECANCGRSGLTRSETLIYCSTACWNLAHHHGEAEGSKSDPDVLKARRRLRDQSRQPKRTYPRFPGSRKTA